MTLVAATAITLGGVYYIHESQRTEREVQHPARCPRQSTNLQTLLEQEWLAPQCVQHPAHLSWNVACRICTEGCLGMRPSTT